MNTYRLLVFIVIILSVIACDEDEHFNTNPNFRLAFSTDTISFDTLFTGFGSTTKQLKVKNTSANAINISHLYLQNSESPYRLNVNGIQSNDLMDVVLDANDSLFIFIEVNLDPKDEDIARILKDQLRFELNGHLQTVILETFAQDVILVDADISANTIWTRNRPYLLTESVWLAEGVNLILKEGTKVYFKKNTALHVKGNIEIQGSFQRPVYLGSSRLEELYDNVPGQWDGIYFYDESTSNFLSHFTTENGINGLNFTNANLKDNIITIEYGVIRNFTEKGLFVSNSSIVAHDLLVTNCGEECVQFEGEGNYQIDQSTFYNSWFYSPRSSAVLSYNGIGESALTIRNSIAYGTQTNELELESISNVSVSSSLLKIGSSAQSNYSSVLTNCLFNENPDFLDLEESNFALKAESPAINNGNVDFISTFFFDLAGNRRDKDLAPDMGCFEFVKTE